MLQPHYTGAKMAAACTSMEKDHATCRQHVCVRADSQNPGCMQDQSFSSEGSRQDDLSSASGHVSPCACTQKVSAWHQMQAVYAGALPHEVIANQRRNGMHNTVGLPCQFHECPDKGTLQATVPLKQHHIATTYPFPGGQPDFFCHIDHLCRGQLRNDCAKCCRLPPRSWLRVLQLQHRCETISSCQAI